MYREPTTARSRGATEAVGVLGATSFVGRWLLARLHGCGLHEPGSPAAHRPVAPVFAFSRTAMPPVAGTAPAETRWHQLPVGPGAWQASIPLWIAVCPLWAVAEHFPLLKASGATRLVALSSTSRFTKRNSAAAADRATAARLGINMVTIDNTLYDAFGQRQVSNIYKSLNQYHVVMQVARLAGLPLG